MSSPVTLLTIPAELRLNIYDAVLEDLTATTIKEPALFSTCRLIKNEGIPLYSNKLRAIRDNLLSTYHQATAEMIETLQPRNYEPGLLGGEIYLRSKGRMEEVKGLIEGVVREIERIS